MFRLLAPVFVSAVALAIPLQLPAAFTVQNGKIIDADYIPTMSAEEHFNCAAAALESCDWREADRNFTIVTYHFPHAACTSEAYFYRAVALYNLQEFDAANEALTAYLQNSDHPRLFLETMEYKYAIAEKFRAGAKRRLFGSKRMPKWVSGQDLAFEIYDEIVAALPSQELAARALYSKGELYWSQRLFEPAVESFQMITKRFPKNELAAESFLTINKVYIDQARFEFQNPDLLAFAQINTRRFEQQFPHEERLVEARQIAGAIEEVYGRGLYDTGAFYERIKQPQAAIIYYQSAVAQFPSTPAAQYSIQRLTALGGEIPSEEAADGQNSDCSVS
jgi:outer membrane protein assembly factor BamD (BamD/ComL family)